MNKQIFLKKEYLINLALLLFFLGIISFGSAILAQSSTFNTRSFATGLTGGNAQGTHLARTYMASTSGTANAQGSFYVGNIGFFGNSQYSMAPPSIIFASVNPPIVSVNQAISFFINSRYASDVSANITLPNNSTVVIQLLNAQNNTFTNTSLIGNYSVSFIAKNNFGNRTYNLSFSTTPIVLFNITINNENSSNISYSIVAEAFDYIYARNQSDGSSQITLPQTIFNLKVDSQDYAVLTLRGINVSQESNKQLLLDRYETPEYLTVRAINNSYNITNATIRIYYSNLSIGNKGRLKLFVCHDYEFSNRNCYGTWNDITSLSVNDQTNNYLEYDTPGFSAFSILETPEPETIAQSVPEKKVGFFSVRRDMEIKQEIDCDQTKITLFDEEQNQEVYASQLYLGKNDELSSKYYIDNKGGISIKLSDGKYRLVAKSKGYFDKEIEFEIDCKQEIELPVIEEVVSVEPKDEPNAFVIGLNDLPEEQKPEEIIEPIEEVVQSPEEYKKTVMKDARIGVSLLLLGFALSILIVLKISKSYLYDSRSAMFEKIFAKKKETIEKNAVNAKTKIVEKPKLVILKSPIEKPSEKIFVKPIDQSVIPTPTFEPFVKQPVVEEQIMEPKVLAQVSEEQALIDKARSIPELREVEDSKSFILSNGRKINSILGLAIELAKMDELEFKKFVNENKNDFAKWTYDVVNDPILAQKLGAEKRKEQSRRIVLERIGELLEIK